MADYAISYANLSAIERNLSNISRNISAVNNSLDVVDSHVDQINSNVKVVYDEVEALAREFRNFVQLQMKANAKSNAQQRLIQIRQELDKALRALRHCSKNHNRYPPSGRPWNREKGNHKQRNGRINDFNSRLLAGSLLGGTGGVDQRPTGACYQSCAGSH